MTCISRLSLVSECPPVYMVCLIASVTNVKFLTTGISTSINDNILSYSIAYNRLQCLEELRVAKSQGLTARMLYYLAANCPNLRVIRSIDFWSDVSPKVNPI